MSIRPQATPNRRGLRPRENGRPHCRGFTLLEVLIAATVLSLLFLAISPFFAARFSASTRVVEDTLPAIIGRGIADAITVGAEENYDPVHNILYFDYEGVRVEIDLPNPYETREYPGIVIRDSRNGIIDSLIDPNDIVTVTPGGYALSNGIVARPGANRIFESGTVVQRDDRIVRTGLYPLGPVAWIALPQDIDPNAFSDPNTPVPPPDLLQTVGLPIGELDRDGDGTFEPLENFNGSVILKRGGVIELAQDTYEDTGPDNRRSREEPGYDPIFNPDPVGDDFDPILNPSGPENNGRLDRKEDLNGDELLTIADYHLDEDINGDGLLNGAERDLNGNELRSDRGFPIADRPPTAASLRAADPNSPPVPIPAFPRVTDAVRSIGYAIAVSRPSDESIYLFRILIYKDYLKVRPLLSQATPIRRRMVSTPEVGDFATNDIDDDLDGVIDDGPRDPFGSGERLLNGVDDDEDGVIDDGFLIPVRVHTLVLRIESGATISLPGDPR